MNKVVNGYIRNENARFVNDTGPIQLKGWGIGNFLLAEGYMWNHAGSPRMDRQRRIETVIRELIGRADAEEFWRIFHENYFTEKDVARIKAQGFNSIRLPIDWRFFIEEDEPQLTWKPEGWEILARVVDWCRAADLYVWIDLHGAPGGQTGANIDDCIDDMPRLFIDKDKFALGLALWEEIARRYKNEPVVAGYDLLNEPIRPGHGPAVPDCDDLVPELVRFYKEAIARIRALGDPHCIALEGHHWATDTAIFNQSYDDNCCVNFHRYWDEPEEAIFEKFLALREKYQIPLWLGETGENNVEWFAAISQICDKYEISYHFWTYKRMGERVSAEVQQPADWEKITSYANQGPAPSPAEAKRILWEFLDNIKLENCRLQEDYDAAILRTRPYMLRATSFDQAQAQPKPENLLPYRRKAGLEFVKNDAFLSSVSERDGHHEHHLLHWWVYDLVLHEGESVTYPKPNFDGKLNAQIVRHHGDFKIDGSTIFCSKGFVQIESVRFE